MLEASLYVAGKLRAVPKAAIVLGSGLGEMGSMVEDALEIPYEEIPGFLRTTTPGHAGKLISGKLAGVDVLLMSGRFHHYEGYSHQEIALPVRMIKELGAEYLILTNASGGINTSFVPGDLMLVEDHINLSGSNPLIGPNREEYGPRFPDMSRAYHRGLSALIRQAAEECCIPMKTGVYIMFNGPSFETPAEIRMARILGADAVGMSTVPEVIAANHCSLPVAVVSCISNMAAGILDQPLTLEDVVETGERVKEKFSRLMIKTIEAIGKL